MKRIASIHALSPLLAPFLLAPLLLGFGEAHAMEPATLVTPPAMYPPDTWEGRSAAVVRVLDKLDARVQTLTIPMGQDGTYKSLTISVHSCLQHPVGLAPDSAALLTVQDGHSGTKPLAAKPFDDWMFAAEPFVAVFESPVYGVQLIACAGTEIAPAAPPLLPPVPPAPQTGAPDSDKPDSGAPQLLRPPTVPPLSTPGN